MTSIIYRNASNSQKWDPVKGLSISLTVMDLQQWPSEVDMYFWRLSVPSLYCVLDSQCKIRFLTTSLTGAQMAAKRKGINEVFEFISPSTVAMVSHYDRECSRIKHVWQPVEGAMQTQIDVTQIVLASIYHRDVTRHFQRA